ncbi:MAG: hypothetical protein OXL36_21055 [Bryobacterales bacterium]|nr:hypothetical protein [Bryobacterales bacterium]
MQAGRAPCRVRRHAARQSPRLVPVALSCLSASGRGIASLHDVKCRIE